FHHFFCQHHIVFEVCKCDLRFYHPEFSSMPRCIRILSPECRAEGIYSAKCHAVGLSGKLSADSQTRLPAEEILRVIHTAVLIPRYVIRIQRGHPEHLTRTFTVTCCYDRGVDIYEAPLLEKLVYGVRSCIPQSEDRRKSIGPRSQVGYGAQEFK